MDKDKRKELDVLAQQVEPYWDEKEKKLQEDSPDNIKKAYKRLLELFQELMRLDAEM